MAFNLKGRSFLKLLDFTPKEIEYLIDLAGELKRLKMAGIKPRNLEGKNIDEVNTKAFEGTLLAHTDGDVPNFIVNLPQTDAYTLGYVFYFFEIAVGISGYLNGVNPFNQPGVEAYKSNMFALLGKPGFEELREKLQQRLK